MKKELELKVSNDFKTDKKKNMEYWDTIDSVVFDCISNIAAASTTKLHFSNFGCNSEDDFDLESEMYACGLIPDVRDKIINALKNFGGTFPFVDQNY